MIITYVNKPPVRDWGKTLTEPDQNYTVKQLFERFARGLPVLGAVKQPVFLGEENDIDLEKVNNMSHMEKSALADELAERAEFINNDLEQRKAKQSANDQKPDQKPETAPTPVIP